MFSECKNSIEFWYRICFSVNDCVSICTWEVLSKDQAVDEMLKSYHPLKADFCNEVRIMNHGISDPLWNLAKMSLQIQSGDLMLYF